MENHESFSEGWFKDNWKTLVGTGLGVAAGAAGMKYHKQIGDWAKPKVEKVKAAGEKMEADNKAREDAAVKDTETKQSEEQPKEQPKSESPMEQTVNRAVGVNFGNPPKKKE